MRFADARTLATEIQEMMQPYCERIEIAGSIRRNVLEVKDLELVCIPKWEVRPTASLFGETERVNLLHEALTTFCGAVDVQWIKPSVSEIVPWRIQPDGKYWRALVAAPQLSTVKLDLFLCRRENWGVIFTIRTGSADFSRELVTRVRDGGVYRVQGGSLMRQPPTTLDAEVVCLEEQEFFDYCGIKYLAPSMRRTANDVVML